MVGLFGNRSFAKYEGYWGGYWEREMEEGKLHVDLIFYSNACSSCYETEFLIILVSYVEFWALSHVCLGTLWCNQV